MKIKIRKSEIKAIIREVLEEAYDGDTDTYTIRDTKSGKIRSVSSKEFKKIRTKSPDSWDAVSQADHKKFMKGK